MLVHDPFNFKEGSFYLMKNEKMIILLQILERGYDYIVYQARCAEFDETTPCHAEENTNINEITKEVFEHGKSNPNYLFTLSPINQVNFKIYRDLKYSIAATVNLPELITLVKSYFLKILAYKLRSYFVGTDSI